jgi:hypothetical protein
VGLLSSVSMDLLLGDSLIGDWTSLVEQERCLLVEALVRTGANQRRAAQLLRITGMHCVTG